MQLLNSADSGATTILVGLATAQASITASRYLGHDSMLLLAALAVIGFIIGLGHALACKEELPLRRIIGKTLISTGVSIVAGAVYYFKPGTDPVVILALGSLLSVLGSGWLEAFVFKKTGVQNPGGVDDDS